MIPQVHSENGMVHVPSKYSVEETCQRLESLVKSRGLTVFALIDFSGDAAKVGLRMRTTQLLIFGNHTRIWRFARSSTKTWAPAIFLPGFHKAQREAHHDIGHDGIDIHFSARHVELGGDRLRIRGHVRAAHQETVQWLDRAVSGEHGGD